MKEILQKILKTLKIVSNNFKLFNSFGSKTTIVALVMILCLSNVKGQTPNDNLVAAINCGGPDFTAADGTVFSADVFHVSGGTFTIGDADDIVGTEDDVLYKSERNGNFGYEIPVPAAGEYKVTLLFAEVWFGSADSRIFNVSIEGQEVLSNFDIVAEVGKNVALKKEFELEITDGVINIAATTVKSDGAKISAVMVEKVVAADNTPPITLLSSWSAGVEKTRLNGKNRMLVVVTGTENGSEISTTSITYGGQPMTKVIESVAGTSYREYSSIFILKEAGITAATNDSIKVTWSASLGEGFSISSAMYENVDQSIDPADTSSATTTSSLVAPEMIVGNGDLYILGSALANSYTSIDNGFTEELIQLKNSIVDGTQLKWGNTVIHSKTGTGVAETATLTIGAGRGALSGIVLKRAKNLIKTPVVLLDSWTSGTTKVKAAGTKRLLVAMVTGEISVMDNLTDIGLTYGGQAMNKVVSTSEGTTGFGNFSYIFTLNEAGIAAADETGTLVPSWTTTAPADFDIFSAFYDKVDQTTPVSDTSFVHLNGALVTAPAVTAAFGDVVLMSVAFSGQPRTPTYTTGFIEVLKNPEGKSWGSGIIAYKDGDGEEVIPSITNSSGERAALTAIVLMQGEEEGLPPVYYNLTVNPPIGGTIKIDPIRVKYAEGTEVKVKAIPDFGYYFVNWTDSLNTVVEDTSIIMNSNKTITANFAEKTTYTITTEVSDGNIILSPAGGTYYEGVEVTVLVKANVGFEFKGWGGDLSGTDNPQIIVMNSNKTISANIEKIPAYVLTLGGDHGSVKALPMSATYEPGSAVVLVATPVEGYKFRGWEGDHVSTNNPTSLIMNSDKTINAIFTLIESYTLTTTAINGSVTLDPPGGTYEEGTEITLTATPEGNRIFSEWSGDLTGSENPATIIMDANKTIEAIFDWNVAVEKLNLPEQSILAQNYPNPFSEKTVIPYQLTNSAHVRLTAYNYIGEKVRTFVNDFQTAGYYNVEWDANDNNGLRLANGVYFYRLEIDNKSVFVKKTVLTK